jgi:hypothetical protein
MGLVRDWIREMGNTWDGMSQGNAASFMGVPQSGGGTGTGHGSTPDGIPMTQGQRQILNQLFHDQYGRFPISEHEFQQWLQASW